MIYISSFWSLILIVCVVGQTNLPYNPCPDVFSYEYDGRQWKGLVTITRNLQQEQEVVLFLEFSVRAAISPNSGKVDLINNINSVIGDVQANRPIKYTIMLPTQNPLASVNTIKENGRVICSGQPLQSIPGQGVTVLSLQHTLKLPQMFNSPQPSYPDYGQPVYSYSPPPPPYSQQTTERSYPPPPYYPPSSERPIYRVPDRQTTRETTTTRTVPVYRPPPPTRRPVTVQTNRPPVKETIIPSSNSNNVKCGLAIVGASLAFGGNNITRGDWPWIVAMFVKVTATGLNFHCGGTLVSERHVITAAHCLQEKSNPDIQKLNRVVLFLGKHNLDNLDELDYLEVKPKQFIIHDDWNIYESRFDADIAIIETKTSIEFNTFIQPICLWPDNNLDLNLLKDKKGSMVGWGRTNTNNQHSTVPQLIELPVVNNEACVLSHTNFAYFISNRTFCAGNKEAVGPCTGDSGSGLVIFRNGAWRLRGIVSNSLPDPETRICDVRNYAVFTDVAKFTDWINEIIHG